MASGIADRAAMSGWQLVDRTGYNAQFSARGGGACRLVAMRNRIISGVLRMLRLQRSAAG